VPEKSRGILARAKRQGQPQAGFPAVFATAARFACRAIPGPFVGLILAFGAPGTAPAAPDGATPVEVAARFVRLPAGAAELATPTEGANAAERVAAALLAPSDRPPAVETLLDHPEVALELLRRLPRPTPAPWLPAIALAVGRGGIGDEVLLEWIGKATPAAARVQLRAIADLAASGRAAPALGAAALNLLAATEEPAGAADLFADELRPELDVVAAARHAFGAVLARARADERSAEVADVERQLFARHPELPSLALDAAAASIEAGDRARADSLLQVVVRANSAAVATSAIEALVGARLALAWSAWLGDASRGVVGEAAQNARALPRPPLAQEDPLHVLELRAALVAAWIGTNGGNAAESALVDALTHAPVDTERCFVDEAFFGPFGPAWAREPARRVRRIEPWLAATLLLVNAVEHTHGHGHNGLLAAAPADDEDERVASWIFLRAAEVELTDLGDPERARALLLPRIPLLEKRRLDVNQQLLVETRLLEARCDVYRGDAAAAESALEAAYKLATSLQTGAGAAYVQRLARGEPAAPPPGRPFWRAAPPHAPLVARVLLARSNLRATLQGNVEGACDDLLAAGAELPWESDHWLRCALDFARRKRRDDAELCLACVERSPGRLYDLACVHALLGRPEQSVALLAEHLARRCVTAAGRALELAYARRDPDLATVRDHPKFPRE
jgi:hypothetical protein